jgi:sarcosine oxidase subunit beta
MLDFDNARFPIHGGLLQRRGGTARHDAVAWGIRARREQPRRRHHPELRGRGISRDAGRVRGVETDARFIAAKRVGLAVPEYVARRGAGGLRLPIESHVLQAFVTKR